MGKRSRKSYYKPPGGSYKGAKIKPKEAQSPMALSRRTLSGESYPYTRGLLEIKLKRKGISKENISTIMAFYRNYALTHSRLPTFSELQEVFPYLKSNPRRKKK